MTATTLTPTEISAAFIAALKAEATITNVFGQEIREMNWMNINFAYPSLRIDGNSFPEQPLTGNCKGKTLELTTSIFVFVNDPSSKTCQDYMGIVGKFLQNRQIRSADLYTSPLTIGYIWPVTDGESLWRGEVTVMGRVYEL